jgi:phospholipase/lecithinase/hemolysin
MLVDVRRARFWLYCVLLAFVACAPGRAAADGGFDFFWPDRIVVFGTSLSDPGNAFALSHQHLVAPYVGPGINPLTLIPESEWPYAAGGDRFSNGATWIEQLGGSMGLPQSVKPAYVASVDGSANYAVGGTRARSGVAGEISLSDQVTRYLTDAGPHAPSRALIVIEVGSNDVNDALLLGNPAIINQALSGVVAAISTLYHQAGARKFLVWNVPNLSRTPAVGALDEADPSLGIPFFAEAFSRGYNDGLRALLDALPTLPQPVGTPEADIILFDAFGRLENIVEHRRRYGLQNVTDACIKPGTPPPSRCANQDGYLFWDGIHPTRAGHRIVAIEVGKALIADILADH